MERKERKGRFSGGNERGKRMRNEGKVAEKGAEAGREQTERKEEEKKEGKGER